MRMPALWVYKCNATGHGPQVATGDWQDFFAGPQPGEWGGDITMRSASSLKILWTRMQPGDLVLCWQTDQRAAVGLAELTELIDWTGRDGAAHRTMMLRLVGQPFDQPVPLLDLRKTDRQLATVTAFRSGVPATLYPTTAREARLLLRACGLRPGSLSRSSEPADPGKEGLVSRRHGAGFSSEPGHNDAVEAAAVAAFKRHYRGWLIRSKETENLGYDFDAAGSRGRYRHVELKGVSGSLVSFPIHDNEVRAARTDPRWHLVVVTDALTATPTVREWAAEQFLAQFTLRPVTTHIATLRAGASKAA